ncbi:MAG: putative nicotinate-nucleotide pyrophosphorylase [carboxylating] [Candidatus Thorarchaeota archaeon]|nr:MAG: putative nicotinate-nucleotide pyrophosphorylase [carboxylating] [Candidatus Thorarchaeota archaeon]
MRFPPAVIKSLKYFLEEDIRSGDVTTKSMGPLNAPAVATILAKSKAILAGVHEIAAIAEISDVKYEILVFEGNWVDAIQPVMRLRGHADILLSIERVCLNIIQRMSGIATKAYRMASTARKANPKVKVAATRKTTPGFRFFEKRAVQIGGADPHRYALDDMVLIKNNHIAVMGGVSQAIRAAKDSVSFSKKVSCEVRNIQEALDAVNSGADIILLDNFDPEQIGEAHRILSEKGLRDRIILEASGGIDESNVASYAEKGVDIISSGALTHSYDSADFSMSIALI